MAPFAFRQMWLPMLFVVVMVSTVSGETFEQVLARRCKPGSSCYPSDANIKELSDSLTGDLLQDGDSEFDDKSRMYNTQEQRKPNLIVVAENEEDISKAILFGRKYNLHVTVKSSGHSFVGRSTWDGALSINLSEMKEISVDLKAVSRNPHGELKVQSGLTWIEIYTEVDKHDRVVVGGSAHTVAAGGYTLGGGHSPITRSLGYAVDNLLEIRVVLADGSIATCTETQTVIEYPNGTSSAFPKADLFWAQRGGGGGSFGVVVHFVYKVHLPPQRMGQMYSSFALVVNSTVYNGDRSENLLNAVPATLGALPNTWGGYMIMDNVVRQWSDKGVDYKLTGKLEFFMNKFAPLDDSDNDAFKSLIDLAKQYVSPFSFENKSTFLEYEKGAIDPPKQRTYITNTLLPLDGFTEEFRDFMRNEILEEWSKIGAYFGCTGTFVGGKATEFPVDSTALHPGYRKAVVSLSCGVMLSDPDKTKPGRPDEKEKLLIKKADAMSEKLRSFGEGMYFNEPTKHNPHWKTDFWGNYTRLQEIKEHYDPDNFFVCEHCVIGRKLGGSDVSRAAFVQAGCLVTLIVATIACLF